MLAQEIPTISYQEIFDCDYYEELNEEERKIIAKVWNDIQAYEDTDCWCCDVCNREE